MLAGIATLSRGSHGKQHHSPKPGCQSQDGRCPHYHISMRNTYLPIPSAAGAHAESLPTGLGWCWPSFRPGFMTQLIMSSIAVVNPTTHFPNLYGGIFP
jgi:hypothetical protein